jgi:predicted transcriptional regulator
MEMSTLTIRLPDDTAQRLKSLAQSRGLSMNKLVEQLSAHALAAWAPHLARSNTFTPPTLAA